MIETRIISLKLRFGLRFMSILLIAPLVSGCIVSIPTPIQPTVLKKEQTELERKRIIEDRNKKIVELNKAYESIENEALKVVDDRGSILDNTKFVVITIALLVVLANAGAAYFAEESASKAAGFSALGAGLAGYQTYYIATKEPDLTQRYIGLFQSQYAMCRNLFFAQMSTLRKQTNDLESFEWVDMYNNTIKVMHQMRFVIAGARNGVKPTFDPKLPSCDTSPKSVATN